MSGQPESARRPSVAERYPGVDLGRVEGLLHTQGHQNRVALLSHKNALNWEKLGLGSSERGYINPLANLNSEFLRLYPKIDADLTALLRTQPEGWTTQEIGAAWGIQTGEVARPDDWPAPGSREYVNWWNDYEERNKEN